MKFDLLELSKRFLPSRNSLTIDKLMNDDSSISSLGFPDIVIFESSANKQRVLPIGMTPGRPFRQHKNNYSLILVYTQLDKTRRVFTEENVTLTKARNEKLILRVFHLFNLSANLRKTFFPPTDTRNSPHCCSGINGM